MSKRGYFIPAFRFDLIIKEQADRLFGLFCRACSLNNFIGVFDILGKMYDYGRGSLFRLILLIILIFTN